MDSKVTMIYHHLQISDSVLLGSLDQLWLRGDLPPSHHICYLVNMGPHGQLLIGMKMLVRLGVERWGQGRKEGSVLNS